jgi:hypothetical protein
MLNGQHQRDPRAVVCAVAFVCASCKLAAKATWTGCDLVACRISAFSSADRRTPFGFQATLPSWQVGLKGGLPSSQGPGSKCRPRTQCLVTSPSAGAISFMISAHSGLTWASTVPTPATRRLELA